MADLDLGAHGQWQYLFVERSNTHVYCCLDVQRSVSLEAGDSMTTEPNPLPLSFGHMGLMWTREGHVAGHLCHLSCPARRAARTGWV